MRGKAEFCPKSSRSEQDHPRLCGEKAVVFLRLVYGRGSPPPMRGKGLLCISCVGGFGITPAYAGKSYFHGSSQRKNQDHPRLCGEKIRYMLEQAGISGSPPPMRGKGLSGLPPAGTAGITPAYAGKSCIHVIFCTFFQDHPRLCGEKYAVR